MKLVRMQPHRHPLLFVAAILIALQAHLGLAQNQHISASSIPTADLIQPADLAASLQSASPKPLILQVGSHVLFAEAHIPGSEYAGPTGLDAGLQTLKDRVASLPKNTAIVLYCGCCPWERCPNIAPAYNLLHSQGFTHLKVLYIADNFGANWVSKGYPVAKGR
ncbi:rhodanese-like domain-containing protein [Edaphobacter bradus]|uniref:rhodanese-like domain-containing protein n=1 Tax=Edaphobacter bradus TaxID=2259016 RepID=UPI0021E0AB90|nr:rhodanese-like domain-containing protein [Edaphobacter bradus]